MNFKDIVFLTSERSMEEQVVVTRTINELLETCFEVALKGTPVRCSDSAWVVPKNTAKKTQVNVVFTPPSGNAPVVVKKLGRKTRAEVFFDTVASTVGIPTNRVEKINDMFWKVLSDVMRDHGYDIYIPAFGVLYTKQALVSSPLMDDVCTVLRRLFKPELRWVRMRHAV